MEQITSVWTALSVRQRIVVLAATVATVLVRRVDLHVEPRLVEVVVHAQVRRAEAHDDWRPLHHKVADLRRMGDVLGIRHEAGVGSGSPR